MQLKKLPDRLSVCQIASLNDFDLNSDFYFIGKTDEELSLVCKTEDVPMKVLTCDDNWRGFRIEGQLDFSLIGILSRISSILADHEIGIIAVSTFNTDYILVKEQNFDRAMNALEAEGYEVT